MEPIAYRQEVKRKLVHLSSLWMPVLYLTLEQVTMVWLIAALTLGLFCIDLLRLQVEHVQRYFGPWLEKILRPHELVEKRLMGATYMMVGVLLTVVFFEKVTAIAALLVLILGDTAAALVGRKWGKHKLYTKSWEGTAAFLVASFCAILVLSSTRVEPRWILCALAGCVVACIVELFAKQLRLDDNIAIPLAFSATVAIGMRYVY